MALQSTAVGEVRVAGSDTACSGFFDPGVSSPGTDYSQQNSAQVSFTDLAIQSTNTQVKSAGNPFTSVHVGNTLLVPSGIANFTAATYTILSVSANVATLDSAIGTANSTQASGTIYLGGAKATPGGAFLVAVGSNIVYLFNSSGGVGLQDTFTISSSTVNVSGGRISMPNGAIGAYTYLIGYATNRTKQNTDLGPIIDLGTAMTTGQPYVDVNLYCWARNFDITNSTNNVAGYGIRLENNLATTDHIRVYGSNHNASNYYPVYGVFHDNANTFSRDCYVTHCDFGFSLNGGTTSSIMCTANACRRNGFYTFGGHVILCIAANTVITGSDTNDGVGFFTAGAFASGQFAFCSSYNNGSSGFMLYEGSACINCVAVNNGGHGWANFNGAGGYVSNPLYNCASYNNTLGNYDTTFTAADVFGFISLTANPFTNAGNLDFSLNNTAGGGKSLRGAGYPATYVGTNTNSFFDVGAAQHQDPGPILPSGAIVFVTVGS